MGGWKARHTVLSILFITWIVSHMDRMVMTIAIPYIAKDFGLTPVAMGGVMSAFFAGYALSQIPGGLLADRIGARRLMAGALTWWSAFTAFTGWAGSLPAMLAIRTLFGIGEGVFPGGYFKSVAYWFPVKERATANAFVLSSNALGPALASLFMAAIMIHVGWRNVFLIMFIPGMILAVLIWIFVADSPDRSPRVSQRELDEIRGDDPVVQVPGGKRVTFAEIIRLPIVWQLLFIWFAFDITLWGFVSWMPTYLVNVRGFTMVKMGLAMALPFLAGAVGIVIGGYFSDKFFSHRRRTLFILSGLMGAFFLYLTYTVSSAGMAVAFQTCAGFFMMLAMGAFWGIPITVLPKEVMGASSATINFGGQVAGFISPIAIGFLVQSFGGSFNPAFMFLIAGTLAAILVTLTLKEDMGVKGGVSRTSGVQ